MLHFQKKKDTQLGCRTSVNFYMPGVTGTENIQVYQLADGQWSAVTVAEVRADHVVVDMTSYGVLAFIQVQ